MSTNLRLSRVMAKKLFAQTIPEKIFGTRKRNPVKLDKTRKG